MIDFGKGLAVTHLVLDAAALRTRVIMHNIANQNTPGYKRYTVSFEDQLRKAHAGGDDVRTAVRPEVSRDTSGPRGENNVSVMQELATLDKIKLVHEMFARRAGGYFAHLKKAIVGHA